MAQLKYWDGTQYLTLEAPGGAGDEVAIQADEPTESLDIWIDTDEMTGPPIDQATADTLYVSLSGDTMTGALTLGVDPSQPLGAAPKRYVDQVITVSTNGPSGVPARDGLLWMQVPPTAPV